jgi:hypothetical protein
MNAPMVELQRMGVGLLIGPDVDKSLHNVISKNVNESLPIFITNCPRMKKALELCGYEVLGEARVNGIETFMKY